MADPVFKFYTFPDNNVYSVSIPISSFIYPIASVSTKANQSNQVLIRVTVGWEAALYGNNINRTDIFFKLWRGSPITDKLICSAKDSAEPNVDRNKTVSFAQVDTGFLDSENVTYTLTAETPLDGSLANIIGGLTMTVLVI